MAVPRRVALLWKVLGLIEGRPEPHPTARQVQAERERRKRLIRLRVATLVVGRVPSDVRIDQSAAVLADGVTLPLRIYRPATPLSVPPPVVVNYHGGGFALGDPQQSEWWCASVAAGSGAVVVSVDYRLAPEHRFPTPVHDCYAATCWVAEHAAALGVDGSRLAVMGDSAGGNLAAVVSAMARDHGGPAIALQVLIYPVVDFVDTYPSEVENAEAPVLTKADMDTFEALYLTAEQKPSPLASVLRGTHEGLPPALVQTAEHDPLRDQGTAYAAALRAAGVPVRLTNYVDAVHGYISLPNVVPAARQALGETVAALRDAFG